jgi:hypothetical protein
LDVNPVERPTQMAIIMNSKGKDRPIAATAASERNDA